MKKIFEGVKFGNKEKAVVLKNANDFNVGIEYEMDFYASIDISDLTSDGFDMLRDRLVEIDKEYVFDDIYRRALDESVELGFLSEGDNSAILVELVRKVYEIDVDAKSKIPSDEDRDTIDSTEDMFGGKDDIDLYKKIFYDHFTDEELQRYVDFFGKALSESITAWDEIVSVIDLYFEAEFLGGNGEMAERYGDYLKLFQVILTKSDNSSNIMALYESMANVSLNAPAEESALNYTIGRIDADTIGVMEYIEFKNDHYEVEMVEELVTDMASSYDMDEMIGDEDNYSIPDVSDLEDHGVDGRFIDTIISEHDDQTEIITPKMNVVDAFTNISQMFEFISMRGETRDMAGMHVSISTNKYKHSDFNLMKFVSLLDLNHILDMFPERRFVRDLEDIISDTIKHVIDGNITDNYLANKGHLSVVQIIKECALDAEADIEDEKYQSIKFGDYNMLNGRIELRFFGGEDYHQMEDDVKHHILRALYLLNFAYTDEHNKVYYKKLAKMVSRASKQRYGVPLSEVVAFINRFNTTHTKKIGEFYRQYIDERDDSQMSEDVDKFNKMMVKQFGDEWEYNLEFLKDIT